MQIGWSVIIAKWLHRWSYKSKDMSSIHINDKKTLIFYKFLKRMHQLTILCWKPRRVIIAQLLERWSCKPEDRISILIDDKMSVIFFKVL